MLGFRYLFVVLVLSVSVAGGCSSDSGDADTGARIDVFAFAKAAKYLGLRHRQIPIGADLRADLKAAENKTTFWDGVRNYQARNLMRDEIKKGDLVLYYHSNSKPTGVAGVARVVKNAYPDPTQFDPKSKYHDPKSPEDDPRWLGVDVKFVKKLLASLEGSAAGARPVLNERGEQIWDIQAIERIMPHRYPMLLVEENGRLEPHLLSALGKYGAAEFTHWRSEQPVRLTGSRIYNRKQRMIEVHDVQGGQRGVLRQGCTPLVRQIPAC